jgi:hypothetical protein
MTRFSAGLLIVRSRSTPPAPQSLSLRRAKNHDCPAVWEEFEHVTDVPLNGHSFTIHVIGSEVEPFDRFDSNWYQEWMTRNDRNI